METVIQRRVAWAFSAAKNSELADPQKLHLNISVCAVVHFSGTRAQNFYQIKIGTPWNKGFFDPKDWKLILKINDHQESSLLCCIFRIRFCLLCTRSQHITVLCFSLGTDSICMYMVSTTPLSPNILLLLEKGSFRSASYCPKFLIPLI